MFELIAVNVLYRFEKLDSRSRCQGLEQKDWKLSLEIKSNEYISAFPLIFQFPLNVLCSYKALINSTCNSGLYRIYKHSYFLFFQLITYHWSFVSYQNICISIKWKHIKYHAERSKYPFQVKGTWSQKKFTQGWNFTPGWISTRLRVTCLLDLNLKSAWITLLNLDWF